MPDEMGASRAQARFRSGASTRLREALAATACRSTSIVSPKLVAKFFTEELGKDMCRNRYHDR